MSALAEWQRRFAAALRALDAAPGNDRAAELGRPAGLDVYRNNVRQSLIEALASAFPHTRTLLGPRYFAAAAGDFARDHLPEEPRLSRYGAGFADFLDDLPPLAGHRYVSDVCRLERARLDVGHAVEASALDAARLAEPPDPARLCVTPRPATRRVRCRFAVGALWQRLERGEAPVESVVAGEEDWLAVRRGERVLLTPVDAVTASLYRRLREHPGAHLGDALAAVAEPHGETAAGEALGTLLGLGALCERHAAPSDDEPDEETAP
ncbi:DNA-binding domain-containing protein [Halomonas getboli]|uniref:HvfC/BufC N-terminal domain-containing protein n=1 Tax=Halomonas getboli TaxID=2935862 RepID=UPI001FFE601A|nr:DNA-binding domain-containing protein [Halomonas getboli]MCK2184509.1 DNA-binding domain-containing protein [Halomonas getboli]